MPTTQTIQTIEIATELKTALDVVVTAGTPVYARGVPTDKDGKIADAATCERRLSCVDIVPAEKAPHSHNSVLREFPVKIRVVSWYPDDPFQVELYTLGQQVSDWLCNSPTLTLTLCHFDALVLSAAPEVGNTGENDFVQYMEWPVTVKTRKVV